MGGMLVDQQYLAPLLDDDVGIEHLADDAVVRRSAHGQGRFVGNLLGLGLHGFGRRNFGRCGRRLCRHFFRRRFFRRCGLCLRRPSLKRPQHCLRRLYPRRIMQRLGNCAVFLGAHRAKKALPRRLLHGTRRGDLQPTERGCFRLVLFRRQRHLHASVGAVQRTLHPVAQTFKHVALVEEFDLRLCGMDVDIHQMLRHCQAQHAVGKAPDHQTVAVRLLQRRRHGFGADIPPVDEEKLVASRAARGVRTGNVTRQLVALPAALHRRQLLGRLPSEHGADRTEQRTVARGGELLLPLAQQAEGHLGVCQRQPLHRGKQRRSLHRVALHKFQPRGCVEKQVADDDGRAVGTARLTALRDRARLKVQARAERSIGGLGQQVDARNGTDGGKRLTAEAEGADRLQILGAAELTGGMAQKRRLRVLRLHAAAVVGHAQKGHAAVLNLNGDVLRAGVDRVFRQLLRGAGGTLDDLARCDHIRKLRRKALDFRHFLHLGLHNILVPTLASLLGKLSP